MPCRVKLSGTGRTRLTIVYKKQKLIYISYTLTHQPFGALKISLRMLLETFSYFDAPFPSYTFDSYEA